MFYIWQSGLFFYFWEFFCHQFKVSLEWGWIWCMGDTAILFNVFLVNLLFWWLLDWAWKSSGSLIIWSWSHWLTDSLDWQLDNWCVSIERIVIDNSLKSCNIISTNNCVLGQVRSLARLNNLAQSMIPQWIGFNQVNNSKKTFISIQFSIDLVALETKLIRMENIRNTRWRDWIWRQTLRIFFQNESSSLRRTDFSYFNFWTWNRQNLKLSNLRKNGLSYTDLKIILGRRI